MADKKLLTWSLVISGVLLVGIVVAAGLTYLLFNRFFGYTGPETPPQLSEPRIVAGAGFVSRGKFITIKQSGTSKGIGPISDIAVGDMDSQPGVDIAIAGRYGAMIVDRNAAKQSQVQYEFEVEKLKIGYFDTQSESTMLGDIQIIDIEGDGACEYLGRGSVDGAAVFDHEGRRLWSYGKFTEEKTAIDDLAAGDVNGDGVAEFIALWDGLELFDRHGNKAWAQPSETIAYQAEVVDVDGDRKNEIVYSSGSELIITDTQGQILKHVTMPFYLAQFDLCSMPGQEQRPDILAVADEHVWLTDFDGNIITKLAAPLSRFEASPQTANDDLSDTEGTETAVFKSKGVWVKLKEDQAAFLAVVTEFAAIDRSVLYIYSGKGKLVYQEILPEQCSSIAVLPQQDGSSAQELLLGGSETVWRYNATL